MWSRPAILPGWPVAPSGEPRARTGETARDRGDFAMTEPVYEREMLALPGADEGHRVPSGYWKIIATDERGVIRIAAFLLDQDTERRAGFCDEQFANSVRTIENKTGLNLRALPQAHQSALKTGPAGRLPEPRSHRVETRRPGANPCCPILRAVERNPNPARIPFFRSAPSLRGTRGSCGGRPKPMRTTGRVHSFTQTKQRLNASRQSMSARTCDAEGTATRENIRRGQGCGANPLAPGVGQVRSSHGELSQRGLRSSGPRTTRTTLCHKNWK